MSESPIRFRLMIGGLLLTLSCPAAWGSKTRTQDEPPIVIEQHVIDAAMRRLNERQRDRVPVPAGVAADQPANEDDPYRLPAVIARKLEMIRAYDAQLTIARAALRQNLISPAEVRRLVVERAALQALPLDKFRNLIIEADQQNALRLARFQESFGDLPAAARTVATILMKSGQIDFATALPEDPLTREVEEARGVRRVYFQFYLNPPAGPPRRHNGFVEFVFDQNSALWVPTWTDFCGEPTPLFDAEAFLPLRPYQLVYDRKTFVVAQANSIQPPRVFALLMPRWDTPMGVFAPAPQRW